MDQFWTSFGPVLDQFWTSFGPVFDQFYLFWWEGKGEPSLSLLCLDSNTNLNSRFGFAVISAFLREELINIFQTCFCFVLNTLHTRESKFTCYLNIAEVNKRMKGAAAAARLICSNEFGSKSRSTIRSIGINSGSLQQ